MKPDWWFIENISLRKWGQFCRPTEITGVVELWSKGLCPAVGWDLLPPQIFRRALVIGGYHPWDNIYLPSLYKNIANIRLLVNTGPSSHVRRRTRSSSNGRKDSYLFVSQDPPVNAWLIWISVFLNRRLQLHCQVPTRKQWIVSLPDVE